MIAKVTNPGVWITLTGLTLGVIVFIIFWLAEKVAESQRKPFPFSDLWLNENCNEACTIVKGAVTCPGIDHDLLYVVDGFPVDVHPTEDVYFLYAEVFNYRPTWDGLKYYSDYENRLTTWLERMGFEDIDWFKPWYDGRYNPGRNVARVARMKLNDHKFEFYYV